MSVLSSVAVLPLVSMSSPSIAQETDSSQTLRDREILEVAAQIFEILPKYKAAVEATYTAHREYEKLQPPMPDTLLWRMGDPVAYGPPVLRNGRNYMLCDLHQLEQRRKQPRLNWEFLGADDQQALTSVEDFDDLGYPKPHCAHLWKGKENKRDAARLKEMIDAYDQWTADLEKINTEWKVDELDNAMFALRESVDVLVMHLTSLRAHTLDGMRAKAAVLAQHLILPEETEIVDESFDMVRSLIDDLCGQYPFRIGVDHHRAG